MIWTLTGTGHVPQRALILAVGFDSRRLRLCLLEGRYPLRQMRRGSEKDFGRLMMTKEMRWCSEKNLRRWMMPKQMRWGSEKDFGEHWDVP
jgi:hypothetical protein